MADQPTLGERTVAQPLGKGLYWFNGPLTSWGNCAATGTVSETAATLYPGTVGPYYGYAGAAGEGFAPFDKPPAGTYQLYRQIARTPTVVIALSILTSLVINNEWSWNTRDDGEDEDLRDILKRWFDPMRAQIVTDGMFALNYGFAPFEKIWELVDPESLGLSGEKMFLPRLKPLRVDYTAFLSDASYKKITGLRNRPPYVPSGAKPYVDLGLDKCFWYTFGGEAGDPYGDPLLENIRDVWDEAKQVRGKICKYVNKVSGVVGQIHYPDGVSKNASGVETANYVLAQQMAQAASEGRWLVMQNRFASFIVDPQNVTPAALEKALVAAGKAEWVVSFVDPGGTDHAPGFKELLQYYDVLMVRGLKQPERSLLESQGAGSRADSQTHGKLSSLYPQTLLNGFVTNFNEKLLDDVIEINAGAVKRGCVFAKPDPISDDEYDAKVKVAHAMLQNPDSSAAVGERVDVDELMDDVGIPILEEKRGTPLEMLSQIMPPALKLPNNTPKPGRNGNSNTNEPVGRRLERRT